MKKFEIEKVGLDLRDVNYKIPDVVLDNQSTPDMILVSLLSPWDFNIHSLCERCLINGAKLVVEIDLEKFGKRDPWGEAAHLWRVWEKSYFSLPMVDPVVLFKNLPKNESPNTYPESVDLWTDFHTGLEITDFEGWLEQVENWKTYFSGKVPEYVARDINPLCYNLDLEKWLELSQSRKIGLNWDGGKFNSTMEHEVFGKSYLLAFAGLNSTEVFLPVRTDFLKEVSQQLEFLTRLVGDSVEKEDKFLLKKNVYKLKTPPKKLIYESMKINISGKTWIIPSEENSILYPFVDTSYSFKSPRLEMSALQEEPTELEFAIKNVVDFSLGENRTDLSNEVAWKLLVLSIIDYLKEEQFKPEDRWEFDFVSIGERTLGINLIKTAKKKWYNKHLPEEIIETRDFLLTMPAPDKVYFVDLDNLPENI